MLAVAAVCAWELAFLRTGLFRRASYWVAMAIVLAFQIPVDGWLTKLLAPVVRYAPGQMTGLRFPWDIPIEDFLFGFALVTAALLLWEHQGRPRAGPGPGRRSRAGRPAPGRPQPEGELPARPPVRTSVASVATLVGVCEPADIVANRLDPWHGSCIHPYSFAGCPCCPRRVRWTSQKRRTGSWCR